ncbi:Uncharacterized protein Fot_03245 [Forsythia ovata]|uniref:Uncharacterized protein n=1 Tax=Forsythia ovata TaxID=205694 RepID=A0ABD1X957_9LAMI
MDKIEWLPISLGKLSNVTEVNFSGNPIIALPTTIGNLKVLPEAMEKIEFLEILTLHYNRVKRLPTTMRNLLQLKELDVSFNELESMPESLCFAQCKILPSERNPSPPIIPPGGKIKTKPGSSQIPTTPSLGKVTQRGAQPYSPLLAPETRTKINKMQFV